MLLDEYDYPYSLGNYIYFFIQDDIEIEGDVEIFKYVLGKIVLDYMVVNHWYDIFIILIELGIGVNF